MNIEKLLEEHKRIHWESLTELTDYLIKRHDEIVTQLERLNYKHSSPLVERALSGRIQFLGTRGMVEETSRYHSYYSCVKFIADDGKEFIIDVGETWKEFIDNIIPTNVPVIISHAHPDHLFGLEECKRNLRVAISNQSLKSKYFKKEKYENINFELFEYEKGYFVFSGRKFYTVPIMHSILAPNQILVFSFCGKRICYASDIFHIKKRDRKILDKVDVYIGDGASLTKDIVRWRKEGDKGPFGGHASVRKQLTWCKEHGIPIVVFMHHGSESIKMGYRKLKNRIINLAQDVGYNGKVYVACDGSILHIPAFTFIIPEYSIAEIKDLQKYDPRDVERKAVLQDDWRIMLMWWSSYYAPKAPKRKEKFKWSKELILLKAEELVRELIKRSIKFSHPNEYKPGARDLFKRIIKRIGKENIPWKEAEIIEAKPIVLPGRYLTEPHAERIWKGEKLLIVTAKPYKKRAMKRLYLLGEYAYGIGMHSEPIGPVDADIVREQFRHLHTITDEEWKKWWPEAKTVYLYTWHWIEKFKKPKEYIKKVGPQVYYDRVTIIEVEAKGTDAEIRRLIDAGKWDPIKVEDKEKLMKKRERIEVLYPFLLTKTSKRGYRELEVFDKPSIALLARDWFKEHPDASIFVEVKFDGMRVSGHKKGKKVRIYSEGGEHLEDNLPTLREELRKLPCDSCVLDAEIVPYSKDLTKSFGRWGAIAALGKGEVDDSTWVAHVFDILYLDGKELWKLPYKERRRLLRGLELKRANVIKDFTRHWVENIPIECKNMDEVIEAVEKMAAVKFSEGAMLKLSTSIYPITKRTPLWAKYKKFFDIDVMVVHLFPKLYRKGPMKGKPIPGQNNAACVIGPVTPEEKVKIYNINEIWKKFRSTENYKEWKAHKIQYIRYKGKVWSNIGITMSTAEKLKLGDIIRVTVRLIRKYTPTEYRWLIARVLEKRPEKTVPDGIEVADTIYKASMRKVKASKVIVEFENDYWFDMERLEEYDPYMFRLFDNTIKRHLKRKEIKEVTLPKRPFLYNPPEDKEWQYRLFSHVRGASEHSDLRQEITPEWLVGYTIMIIKSILPDLILKFYTKEEFMKGLKKPGILKGQDWKKWLEEEDVDVISQALTDKFKDEVSRKTLDMKYEEIASIIKKHVHEIVEFFADPDNKAFVKLKAPQTHAWLEEEGRKEPGEMGATRTLPGFFVPIDRGVYEALSQKEYFHEYWYHGNVLNGKFVFRKLYRPGKWAKVGKRRMVWMVWKTLPEDLPYVISRRAVKKKWMPKEGISALPRHIRKQIPKEYQYWKEKGAKAREIRDRLVNAIKKKEVILKTMKELEKEALHIYYLEGLK